MLVVLRRGFSHLYVWLPFPEPKGMTLHFSMLHGMSLFRPLNNPFKVLLGDFTIGRGGVGLTTVMSSASFDREDFGLISKSTEYGSLFSSGNPLSYTHSQFLLDPLFFFSFM